MERAFMPLLIDRGPVQDAIEPLDKVAVDMERKWGVGRLQRLVTPELSAKFSSAREKLNDAIRDNDLEQVVHRAGVVIRGWQALDKAATEAGRKTYPEAVWSKRFKGRTYTVVLDRADVSKVAFDNEAPEHVVTIDELLTVWDDFQGRRVIEQTKGLFPGATVERVGGVGEMDDDIPF
jgi:hypothetical protein